MYIMEDVNAFIRCICVQMFFLYVSGFGSVG